MADMEQTEAREGTLSTWAGPYVTDMLGRAQAYAQTPFQPYEGAFTAGPSNLQTQAFGGIAGLTVPQNITEAGKTLGGMATQNVPAYQAGQFTSGYQAPGAYQAATFSPDTYSQQAIQPYMNPYLESVLEPQRREAQRQADIARTQMQSRMAQAGAYGGSRQAIMEAEAQRNLQSLLGDITGKGYSTAYEDAARRFGEEQARRLQAAQFGEQSRQFGAGQALTAAQQAAQYGLEAQRMGEQSRQFGQTIGLDALGRQIQAAQAQGQAGALEAQYGLANLAQQLAAGATQRDIEQQGLTADYNQYLRELEYPRQMLEFERNMLTGMPIASASFYQPAPSAFQSAAGGAATALQLLKLLQQTSGG